MTQSENKTDILFPLRNLENKNSEKAGIKVLSSTF